MGGITEANVEWAVVNRLKAMLDKPPETKFNVTQSFALFSTVVMWTKNRIWVGGGAGPLPDSADEADQAAHATRERLRQGRICDKPWRLARTPPRIAIVDPLEEPGSGIAEVNAHFADMTAEDFFNWLRNALAHGDGRTIRPIHKRSEGGARTLLAGFEIRGGQGRVLSLYHADMRRLGALLADLFCRTLSATDQYHYWDEATASIDEAA